MTLWFKGIGGSLVFAVLLYAGSCVYAQGCEFRLNGYVKSFFSVNGRSFLEKGPGLDSGRQKNGYIRSRLNLFGRIGDKISLEAAYEGVLRYGQEENNESLFLSTCQISYRIDEVNQIIHREVHGEDAFEVRQDIDRAYVALAATTADFYIGRQPISFGSARAVNPMDVIAPFSFDALDTEERKGVDAVRYRAPIGEMGELDGGIIFADHFKSDESAVYLNTRLSVKKTDCALMSMVFRENLLMGLDVQSSLKGAGYWLETAYVFVGTTGEKRPEEDYLRVSTGFDYNFLGNLYVFIEYHFNGAGEDSARDYLRLSDRAAYNEGQVYLLSRHYLIPGFTCIVTPLSTIRTNIMLNLEDGSLFISPRFEYSLMQDLFVEVGGFIGIGEKGRFSYNDTDGTEIPEVRSEFGIYQDLCFLSLRFYF